MPSVEDRQRQVVPRWRLFEETLSRGELAPMTFVNRPSPTEDVVAEQVQDWKETPTLSVAADLVSVALTLGLDKIAVDAAQFVLDDTAAPAAARGVAAIYLRNAGIHVSEEVPALVLPEAVEGTSPKLTPSDGRRIVEIHRLREFLAEYPRNPIQWCNLALYYTAIGEHAKAERAITVALGLAPNNRFVLRAASRFFLHIGEWHRAHQLLAGSPLVRTDPWILAAEIATADDRRKTSSNMRRGKRILESQQFADKQLSELASAVGTVELKAGKARAGRKLLETSLKDPSENSIAQAAWARRNIGANVFVPQTMKSPEAASWTAWQTEQWGLSLEQVKKWHADQPFSGRPAMLGSFIASAVFENFDQAQAFAVTGLRSNRDDVTLLNNYAFSAAMKGDIPVAEQVLKRIPLDALGDTAEAIWVQATKGLVAFRSGNTELGRELYRKAIALAYSKGDQTRAVHARVYLALEEKRAGTPNADELCDEALKLATKLAPPMDSVLTNLINRRLGKVPAATGASSGAL